VEHLVRQQPLIGIVNQVENGPGESKRARARISTVSRTLWRQRPAIRPKCDRMDTRAVIAILEEKRAAKDHAAYFIRDWQEFRDQVRRTIAQDPRYQAIKANPDSAAGPTRQL